MSKITEVAELVEKGKAKLVGAAVQSALDEGCEATEILNSMIDAMAVVGERFKNHILHPALQEVWENLSSLL